MRQQLWSLLELLVGEGNGTPLQYSCLENPMDGGAWQAAVHGVAKSWTRLSNFTFTFHFHALEKEMATHSSVLAWRIPGTGSLVSCRLWGRTESDTTEATQQQLQHQMLRQKCLEAFVISFILLFPTSKQVINPTGIYLQNISMHKVPFFFFNQFHSLYSPKSKLLLPLT